MHLHGRMLDPAIKDGYTKIFAFCKCKISYLSFPSGTGLFISSTLLLYSFMSHLILILAQSRHHSHYSSELPYQVNNELLAAPVVTVFLDLSLVPDTASWDDSDILEGPCFMNCVFSAVTSRGTEYRGAPSTAAFFPLSLEGAPRTLPLN